MSAIAALYNVPSNQEELDTWSFAHAAHHRDINRRLYELLQVTLPEFVLDPVELANPGVWIYQHQLVHNDFDALLQISGFDLTDFDPKDQNQLAGWIWLNAQEHYQAANILGIG